MSSTAVESKKSFLCCPAPFGNCCGGQKSRKTSPPINDVKNDVGKNQNNDDKKDDATTNGDKVDKKNPFLDEVENEENGKKEESKNDESAKLPTARPRKAVTPMASPAKVGFLVSFLVICLSRKFFLTNKLSVVLQ